jgi:hypothetical protein
MADDKTQVLIELKLQVKELKKQMDEAKDQFKDLKKTIEKSMGGKQFKELISALTELTRAQKTAAQNFTREEKKKQTAAEGTTNALKKQTKEAKGLVGLMDKTLKRMGPAGRFMGGMGAGMGMGALRKPVTARGAGAAVGRGVSAGIGGAAQFFMSGISSAYQQYLSYGQAVGGLVGMGTPGQMKRGLKGAGGLGGAALGYDAIQTAQQARGVGRATGNIGAVYRAQQFGRGYGLDVGEATGYMGMIRQAGYGFGGMARGGGQGGPGAMGAVDNRGTRELTKIMEAGMVSGIEKARLPEFLQGVGNITQQVGGRVSGKVNVGGIAAFQALLGTTGKAGFQGARGAAVGAQLGQAIQRPGGGEAGQTMMLQALGFGKPGGERGYYEALKMQQQGMDRPETVMDMFSEVYSQLGQKGAGGTASVNQEANLALSEMTGLSLDQIETMGDLLNSGKSQEEIMAGIKEQMENAEPIEEKSRKEMKKGFGGVVSYLAGITDQQIAIGNQFGPMFMKMQQLQLKALRVMAEYLPKVVEWLQESYKVTSMWAAKTLKGILGDPEKLASELKVHTDRMYKAGFGLLKESEGVQARDFAHRIRIGKETLASQQKDLSSRELQRKWMGGDIKDLFGIGATEESALKMGIRGSKEYLSTAYKQQGAWRGALRNLGASGQENQLPEVQAYIRAKVAEARTGQRMAGTAGLYHRAKSAITRDRGERGRGEGLTAGYTALPERKKRPKSRVRHGRRGKAPKSTSVPAGSLDVRSALLDIFSSED